MIILDITTTLERKLILYIKYSILRSLRSQRVIERAYYIF